MLVDVIHAFGGSERVTSGSSLHGKKFTYALFNFVSFEFLDSLRTLYTFIQVVEHSHLFLLTSLNECY